MWVATHEWVLKTTGIPKVRKKGRMEGREGGREGRRQRRKEGKGKEEIV